ARVAPAQSLRFMPAIGVDVEGSRVGKAPTKVRQVLERVDGVPARLWVVRAGAGAASRSLDSLAAWADEHVAAGRLTLDAGVRLDSMAAGADGAAQGIRWTSWLPRAM